MINSSDRGVINGKTGKGSYLASIFWYIDPISIREVADYGQPLALPHLNFFVITPLGDVEKFELIK